MRLCLHYYIFSVIDQLSFVSYNVRGIQGNLKRRKVFGVLRDQAADVVFLQESHSVKEIELLWQNEYGGNIFYSHATAESKGVMTMFRRGLVYNIKAIKRDFEGRMLIIEVEIQNFMYLLCNIYSPNEDNPVFFVKVAEEMESFDNPNIIWGGDFNLVLNVSLDRHESKHNNEKAHLIITEYMEAAQLNDIWRISHPNDKKYTWFRK